MIGWCCGAMRPEVGIATVIPADISFTMMGRLGVERQRKVRF